MKRLFCVFIALSLVSLTSCSMNSFSRTYDVALMERYEDTDSGPSHDFSSAMTDLPYDQMITKTDDIHEFLEHFGIDARGRYVLNAVADRIGIECLRTNKSGIRYSIHKIKQGGLLYVFYSDDEDAWSHNWFYVQKDQCYSDFSSIEIGSGIQEVERIDPAAQLAKNIFLRFYEYNSRAINSFYMFSAHYLNDGVLAIYYEYKNDDFIVYDIQYFDDYIWRPSDFLGGRGTEWDVSLLPGDWIS